MVHAREQVDYRTRHTGLRVAWLRHKCHIYVTKVTVTLCHTLSLVGDDFWLAACSRCLHNPEGQNCFIVCPGKVPSRPSSCPTPTVQTCESRLLHDFKNISQFHGVLIRFKHVHNTVPRYKYKHFSGDILPALRHLLVQLSTPGVQLVAAL